MPVGWCVASTQLACLAASESTRCGVGSLCGSHLMLPDQRPGFCVAHVPGADFWIKCVCLKQTAWLVPHLRRLCCNSPGGTVLLLNTMDTAGTMGSAEPAGRDDCPISWVFGRAFSYSRSYLKSLVEWIRAAFWVQRMLLQNLKRLLLMLVVEDVRCANRTWDRWANVTDPGILVLYLPSSSGQLWTIVMFCEMSRCSRLPWTVLWQRTGELTQPLGKTVNVRCSLPSSVAQSCPTLCEPMSSTHPRWMNGILALLPDGD